MSSKSLVEKLITERNETTSSILEFSFINTRIKILSSVKEVKSNSNAIIYWMFREMRVQDNWTLLYSQKLAFKNNLPLHIVYYFIPHFLNASARHSKFLLEGLNEVSEECSQLNIPLHICSGDLVQDLVKVVKENNVGGLVCDFSPLRFYRDSIETIKNELPDDVLFCQVDGHNIVPCWEASPKQEIAARTFRPKITSILTKYLTPFPPVIKHPHSADLKIEEDKNVYSLYKEVELPTWIGPGYRKGIEILESFCKNRLKDYSTKRNIPESNVVSNLSPWMNFGQIAPQRVVLEVNKYRSQFKESVNDFCEEVIVRRELSENYCYYNKYYDSYDNIADWAKTSLEKHKKDKRQYTYSLEEFEKGETHDPLWNSAQLELVKNGKMHGYLRMYWAKKILEWSKTPQEAINVAIYLNDYYSFDGRDPNGFVGVMWSICGVHDQGWQEREIFGKIRYMNYEGCKRKFNILNYVEKWGTKEDYVKVSTEKSTKKKRKTK